jgi:two-component system chemotaxis sensor kinase CheA
MSHLIRNAVDHGVESRDERVAAAKPSAARLRLATRVERGMLAIEVSDDGRGIAWDKVATKAKLAKLPHATRRELVAAICADGFSTADTVTEISGRGVGMAAVKEACDALGGLIEINSEPGKGTAVRCLFPERLMGGRVLSSVLGRPVMPTVRPQA